MSYCVIWPAKAINVTLAIKYDIFPHQTFSLVFSVIEFKTLLARLPPLWFKAGLSWLTVLDFSVLPSNWRERKPCNKNTRGKFHLASVCSVHLERLVKAKIPLKQVPFKLFFLLCSIYKLCKMETQSVVVQVCIFGYKYKGLRTKGHIL